MSLFPLSYHPGPSPHLPSFVAEYNNKKQIYVQSQVPQTVQVWTKAFWYMRHNLQKASSHPQPPTYTFPKKSIKRQQQLWICFWSTVLCSQSPAIIQLWITSPSPKTCLVWKRYSNLSYRSGQEIWSKTYFSMPDISETISYGCSTGKTDKWNERARELMKPQQAA